MAESINMRAERPMHMILVRSAAGAAAAQALIYAVYGIMPRVSPYSHPDGEEHWALNFVGPRDMDFGFLSPHLLPPKRSLV